MGPQKSHRQISFRLTNAAVFSTVENRTRWMFSLLVFAREVVRLLVRVMLSHGIESAQNNRKHRKICEFDFFRIIFFFFSSFALLFRFTASLLSLITMRAFRSSLSGYESWRVKQWRLVCFFFLFVCCFFALIFFSVWIYFFLLCIFVDSAYILYDRLPFDNQNNTCGAYFFYSVYIFFSPDVVGVTPLWAH